MTETNMTHSPYTRRSNLLFLIKILVVLIFPLEMVINPPYVGWVSLLLVVHSSQFPAFTSLPSLLVGLIIMLPCIYFERMLNSSIISKSMRKQIVASCILSCGTSMLLLITGAINPIFIPATSVFSSTFLYEAAVYAPILGVSFFVVLPLILRESAKRTISVDHSQLSYQAINSILQKKLRREKVLSGLLWFGLLFCPFLLGLVISGWSNQISLLSVFYIMYFPGYPTFFSTIFYGVPLELIGSSVAILPIMALLSSVRFTFVRDVFRFQGGIINKSRLVSEAILGEILPAAMITSLMLITTSPSVTSLLLFPTPVLPIIGFIHIKLSRTKHLKEELWPEYESRMWYEQKQEPHATESAEESIKVPLTYLLISQVRKFRSKET